MTEPSKNPKKNCDDDCPFLPKGDKNQEETEIQTVDLCNDPVCANVHEKKLVDLTQGLSQLENILKNMTGLCREPKCPSKSPSVQKRIEDSIPPLPKPNRYPPEEGVKDDSDNPKRDIMDYKSCKGTICYSAYMGHKIEAKVKEPEPHVCDSKSCMPTKITPKKICGCPTCPFSRKKDPTAPVYDLPALPTLDINTINKPKITSMGPCGGFTCPPPKEDLFTRTYKAPTNLFDIKNQPCTFDTCPLSSQQEKTEQVPVGLCGRTSCPFASLEYAQRLEGQRPNTPVNYNFGDTGGQNTGAGTGAAPCANATCPYGSQKTGIGGAAPCGNISCPYGSQQTGIGGASGAAPCGNISCPYGSQQTGIGGASGAAPCGNISCPYGSQKTGIGGASGAAPCGNISCPYGTPKQTGPPVVGLCGRTSCPFAAITPNVKPRTTAPCGNPCCTYGETSYDPVGLCGQIECPMLSKTSPGAVKPCPYADKIKRYPCGSPSCPYVNPEGILQTHEYSTDRSYVREAARPYSGSASPYDYMSSLQQSYPTPYATNYPLFTYTQPPATLPPCPYLPKKVFKSCGKPTCPYADGKRPKDDFCIESTCPYGEGICGGPRKFSCDSPNVIHCESPDCQVPLKKNGKGKCQCCGGSLPDSEEDTVTRSCCRGGSKPSKKEKKDKKRKLPTCCRMPEVEEEGICGGPLKFSCESRNVEHCKTDDCKVPQSSDDCGRPDCRKSKNKSGPEPKKRRPSNATTRSLISGMDLEDYEDLEEYLKPKPDPGKCTSKTCPYLRKLVFCDDCGGVLPDEDTPESSTTTTIDSAEGHAGSMEGEMEESDKLDKKESLKKSLEVVTSATKGRKLSKDIKPEEEPKDDEDKPPVEKEISLYQYPGVQIGHKECGFRRRLIPRNMGWLWNIIPSFGNPELWRGYKPGAICKTVYKMILENRRRQGLIDPNEKKKKKRLQFEDLKHCIEVKKKEGDYTITVNPVKDPKTRDPMDNPYMDVTPIQFKVEKEQSEKEPAYCPCDVVSDQLSAHSSEFEFHFTPPAAIPETVLKKQKTLVEAVVQYDCMDLPPELRASCRSFGKGKKGKGGKGKGGKGKKGKKKK